MKKLGYTELSFTVTNPAPWPADNSSKHKPIKVAADNTANLWKAETAIAFYGWQEFWDANRQVEFKINLNEYAGRDIYIYTENTDVYPLEIVVSEFIKIDYEDRSEWLLASADYNGAVRYIDGKGWVMSPASGSGEFWCLISGAVIQKKIADGYTKMTIVYANNLEGSANTDTGNFINTESRLYPCKAGGGYISDYVSGVISSYCVKNEAGNYEHTVSLTDKGIDFTKDQYIYCLAADNSGGVVTRGYIADIVFEKGEPVVQEDKSGWIIGNAATGYWSSVEYIKGKGWIMKDVTNGGAQGEYWLTLSTEVIQKKISEGYTKMTIVYTNSLDGVDNPNEGNFINTGAKIAPTLKGGNYTLEYVKGNINQYCTEVEKDGVKYYEHRIDLTDPTVDFAQVAYIICYNKDAEGKKVTNGYIADIVFEKGEPEGKEDKTNWVTSNDAYWGSVEYIEGKGWIMKDTTDGGTQGQFWCILSGEVIRQKIAEGYTKMTVIYVNGFDGIENPNEGNFINTTSKIYPVSVSGTIAQYCTETEKGGVKYYEHINDLAGSGIDGTKDIDVFCSNKDSENKTVTRGYIADIIFSK